RRRGLRRQGRLPRRTPPADDGARGERSHRTARTYSRDAKLIEAREMKDRLIVGLDVTTVAEAGRGVRDLDGAVACYNLGYPLAFAGGLDFARELADSGINVFLDMKLLDIDNTIAKGVENIVRMGVSMLTLHAYPKAMRAAVEAARGSDLCLLGVTVLTSMDE